MIATDVAERSRLEATAHDLESKGARVICAESSKGMVREADVVVISPGVPPFAELHEAQKEGVPIWSEVELATRSLLHPAPIVAIGGTNGKSTTTTLVGECLKTQSARVFVGGNLGEPLSDRADDLFDWIVLEVSSFQMEQVDRFHPRSAILLNITPDHLDRYASMDRYAVAKGNMFARQTKGDEAIIPVFDEACLAQAKRGGAGIVTFGKDANVRVEHDNVLDSRDGERYSRREWKLVGTHNAMNVAATIACVRSLGVPPDVIRTQLGSFEGLPHRTTLVRELASVRYYDDSKGTNVGASVSALESLSETRVVLIAGGRDKGGSYEPLARALANRGRAVVLIGEAAKAIERHLSNACPHAHAASMDEAVCVARRFARPGDAVLLSPACSSFDMFRDYKHRGDEFVRAVMNLPEVSA